MRIIIVGAGKVGYAVASLLARERHDITVIDRDPETLAYVSNALDVICVEGSGTDFDLLEEAGAGTADMILAATGRDEVNIVCCTAAKRIAAEHGNTDLQTVARVRDPQYTKQTSRLQNGFGLSATVNPERETASEIARILQLPAALRVDTFFGGRLELVEFRVPADSELDGLMLKDLPKTFRTKVLVCAVERDDRAQSPNGDFILRRGDRLSIAASRRELRRFFKAAGASRRGVRNVLIVGGGRIAVYLARELEENGIDVTVVEKEKSRCDVLCELLPKASILCGNGTKREVLQEERLRSLDAFAALTGFDEDNIIVSMYAATCGVGKVVTKVNDEHLIDMLEDSNLDCFVTPKQIVAQTLARHVRAMENASGSSVEALYRLMDGQVEALEFRVSERSRCVGVPLRELRLRRGILIASILRGDEFTIPDGSASILGGDRIVVVTTFSGLNDLDEILEE